MELFCLGPGIYTEEDIREIARTFTEWEVRRDRFRFNKHHTDFRRVCAAVPEEWPGFKSATILGGKFEPLRVFGRL